MALLVEVAGFGVCKTSSLHSVMVICVQQENFQAWTVYRRNAQFNMLAEQLRDLYPSLPALPRFDDSNLSSENLESCRVALNKWIQFAGT